MAADICKIMGGIECGPKVLVACDPPAKILKRAHLPNNKTFLLISINALEMVCVILNMATAIFVCNHDKLDLSTHPVLLDFCNNTAACALVNACCKHSMIGQWLVWFFIVFLMDTKIRVQAEWLTAHLNLIADEILQLKAKDGKGDYDYAQLNMSYPILAPCRCQFQPPDFLLGVIWDILLEESCPDPLVVQALKPKTLGWFML